MESKSEDGAHAAGAVARPVAAFGEPPQRGVALRLHSIGSIPSPVFSFSLSGIAKVLVVGNVATGKTSVINRFARNKFSKVSPTTDKQRETRSDDRHAGVGGQGDTMWMGRALMALL
jgi:hypothetical protein